MRLELRFPLLSPDRRSRTQREVHMYKRRLYYAVFCLAGVLAATTRCEAIEDDKTHPNDAPAKGTLATTADPETKVAAPSLLSRPASTYSNSLGSAYIPSDSWVYPAVLRLYSLGYVDSIFVSM